MKSNWTISPVDSVMLAQGVGPGFTIVANDDTPIMTLIFADLNAAESAAEKMRAIIASALTIDRF